MIARIYKLKLVRYGIFGLMTNGFGYCVYASIIYLGFSYILASLIAFLSAMIISFLFNSKLVFDAQQTNLKQLCIYSIFYFSLWLFSAYVLHVLISYYQISPYIAQVISLVLVVFISFTFLNVLFERK